MTIKEIAAEFNKFEASEGELPEAFQAFNEALDAISEDNLKEARKLLRFSTRSYNGFDDGNMLYGLLLYVVGNRIDGMKAINSIVDPKKNERAISYVNELSGAGKPKAVESQNKKKKQDEKSDVTISVFDTAAESEDSAEKTKKRPPENPEETTESNRNKKNDKNKTDKPAEFVVRMAEREIKSETNEAEADDAAGKADDDENDGETDEKKENNYITDAMVTRTNRMKAVLIIGVCVLALAVVAAIAIRLHLG